MRHPDNRPVCSCFKTALYMVIDGCQGNMFWVSHIRKDKQKVTGGIGPWYVSMKTKYSNECCGSIPFCYLLVVQPVAVGGGVVRRIY